MNCRADGECGPERLAGVFGGVTKKGIVAGSVRYMDRESMRHFYGKDVTISVKSFAGTDIPQVIR
jgi:hypothetical protein